MPDRHGISVEIDDFIYRNTEVKWSISLKGCREFKYIMDVEENNLYVDYDSFYASDEVDSECLYEQIARERRAAELLQQVFFFQIISNFMIFSDAEGIGYRGRA